MYLCSLIVLNFQGLDTVFGLNKPQLVYLQLHAFFITSLFAKQCYVPVLNRLVSVLGVHSAA